MTVGRSEEQVARIGEIELAYEVLGAEDDPPVLMIMGLGSQLVHWPDGLCELLAARGYRVIRFDNRDAGHSTRLDGAPSRLGELMAGQEARPPYLLADMAADAVGLLDHLGIERAHVVGASMGGMIAQTIAIEHPDRVLSLCSIMSNTGARWSGQPKLATYRVLLGTPPQDRDKFIEHVVTMYRVIGSPGFDRDEDDLRDVAARSYDRGRNPAGSGRQLAAIIASGDRTERLRGLGVPTVVIHGTKDRLVSPSGGRATAKAIPGAKLVTIDGMGHDLPRGTWPRIIGAIAENAARAGAPAVA